MGTTQKSMHTSGAAIAAAMLATGGISPLGVGSGVSRTLYHGSGVFNVAKLVALAGMQSRTYPNARPYSRAQRERLPLTGFLPWTQTETQRRKLETPVYPKWMTRWVHP